MSPEDKPKNERYPNFAQQIIILFLLAGFATSQLPTVLERIVNSAAKHQKASVTQDNIEKFPPGFLKDEVPELRPEDVGQYVAVNTLPNIPNDQLNMADRKLVEIRKIYTRQTIKGFFQFFEGADVIHNIDGSFDLGESRIYTVRQILYFLDDNDSEKIIK